jgi:hypothetical protein
LDHSKAICLDQLLDDSDDVGRKQIQMNLFSADLNPDKPELKREIDKIYKINRMKNLKTKS